MINQISSGAFSFSKRLGRENQDSVLLPTPFGQGYIFAVADGVGSYAGALAASSLAIRQLLQSTPEDMNEMLPVFSKIQRRMGELLQENSQYHSSATTLSFCYIDGVNIYIGHTGDTRVYIRKNNKLIQVTKDFTVYQELLDDGIYSKRELSKLEEGKNTLTAALSRVSDVKFQSLMFPIFDYISEDQSIEIFIMSDGAYHYWEHRPRFSINTLKNPARFSSALQRRIETKGPIDDYSLVAAQFSFCDKLPSNS